MSVHQENILVALRGHLEKANPKYIFWSAISPKGSLSQFLHMLPKMLHYLEERANTSKWNNLQNISAVDLRPCLSTMMFLVSATVHRWL